MMNRVLVMFGWRSKLVDCGLLKIERWSQMNEILFIWALWEEYLLLFDLTCVYSYVTNYFILDMVYSMIHFLRLCVFSLLWVNS